MSEQTTATAPELRQLFREIYRLAGSIKNLAFVSSENQVFVATRNVLQCLNEGGPQTVPDLARSRNSSRQNVQIIVDRLQKTGWVGFESNPRHKRSSLVRITRRGQDVLAKSESDEQELLERLVSQFAAGQVRETLDFLARLADAIGNIHGNTTVPEDDRTGNGASRKVRRRNRTGRRSEPEQGEEDFAENSLPVNLL